MEPEDCGHDPGVKLLRVVDVERLSAIRRSKSGHTQDLPLEPEKRRLGAWSGAWKSGTLSVPNSSPPASLERNSTKFRACTPNDSRKALQSTCSSGVDGCKVRRRMKV
jgi:hypothetical protein